MLSPQIRHQLAIGRERYRVGDFDGARQPLETVAMENDHFADVHDMLGVIDLELGRVGDAIKHFERALELNPRFTDAALHLAICLNEQGRYGDARETYRNAQGHRGDDAQSNLETADRMVKGKLANLHAELGDSYLAIGAVTRAEEQYTHALRICPDFVDIRLKLADALRDQGHAERALGELVRIKDTQPDFLRGRLHLGLAYYDMDRRDDAQREWRFVLERDPDNRMGRFYMNLIEQGLEVDDEGADETQH